MNEETKIYDQGDPQKTPEQENTVSNKKDTTSAKTAFSAAIGAAAGAVGGVLGAHLAWGISKDNPELTNLTEEPAEEHEYLVFENLNLAEGVSDDMSFLDAFNAAREEVGAGGLFTWHGNVYGTYYKEEWDQLSVDEQNEYWSHYNIDSDLQATDAIQPELPDFEDIEVATGVTDDMTFGEAFAAARSELGDGGVFAWNGQYYNTYLKEEWNDLPQEQKDEFLTKVYGEVPEIEAEPVDQGGLMAGAEEMANSDDISNPEEIDWDAYPVAEPVHDVWTAEDLPDEHASPADDMVEEAIYDGGTEANFSSEASDFTETDYVEATYINPAHTGAEAGNFVENAGNVVDKIDDAAQIIDMFAPGLIPHNVSNIIHKTDDAFDIINGNDDVMHNDIGVAFGGFVMDAIFHR